MMPGNTHLIIQGKVKKWSESKKKMGGGGGGGWVVLVSQNQSHILKNSLKLS